MLGHRPCAEETDRALRVLAHSYRRRLLFELYEEVTSGEGNSINYSRLDPDETAKRSIELYHVHLPKLETVGYIEWNEAERTIRNGPRWKEVEPLLELVHSHLCDLPPFLQGKPAGERGTEC
ncbi:DUF7344 domain-containing protein [Halobaculum magnesiiphilum]|uniref:DUF7344 domain-containing protein n=1 Tax=Halobaculum magnesiiphilum TaxID=1017351 RepID=UPI003CE56DAE